MLAIAMVLDGHPRWLAARAGGMDRQTLRDWVHRYNADGIAGLSDRRRSGRAPALSAQQLAELKALVLAGPDPARDGVVRWRCVDLRAVIAERYGVVVHERTVGKLLRRMGLTRLQPRPYHPRKDAAAQEAFKKTSPPA
jgi:transposase